eukprot:m.113355 g.113355  ORF g.113355 m.113355 type:complete len:907 (+) comp21458_c0_seq2:202-2922(+)
MRGGRSERVAERAARAGNQWLGGPKWRPLSVVAVAMVIIRVGLGPMLQFVTSRYSGSTKSYPHTVALAEALKLVAHFPVQAASDPTFITVSHKRAHSRPVQVEIDRNDPAPSGALFAYTDELDRELWAIAERLSNRVDIDTAFRKRYFCRLHESCAYGVESDSSCKSAQDECYGSTFAGFLTRVETPYTTTTVDLEAVYMSGGQNLTAAHWRYATPCPRQYVSKDSHAVLVVARIASPRDPARDPMSATKAVWVQRVAEDVAARHPEVTVAVTGLAQVGGEVSSIKHDVAFGDAISIPAALLLMAYTFGAMRFVVIPIFTLAATLGLSFVLQAATWPAEKAVHDVSLNIVVALSIALTIDFTLFSLTRWRDEIRGGATNAEAIGTMLATVGHTIVMSSATLVVCLGGLLLFPVDFIQTLGAVAIATTLSAMVVSLVLTPALLHLLHRQLFPCALLGAVDAAPALARGAVADIDDLDGSRWHRLGSTVTSGRTAPRLIIAIVGLSALLMLYAVPFKLCGGVTQCLAPHGTQYASALEDVARSFGAGRVSPYVLSVTSPGLGAVSNHRSSEKLMLMRYKNAIRHVLGRNSNRRSGVDLVEFDSVLDGLPAAEDGRNWTGAIRHGVCRPCVGDCIKATALWYTNQTAFTVIAEFSLTTNPFAGDAATWLRAARARVRAMNAQSRSGSAPQAAALVVGVHGEPAMDMDLRDYVYGGLPTAILYTVGTCFGMVCLAFRSPLIAAKAVCSVAVTLSFSYCITKMIYQDGLLAWTGLYFLRPSDGVCWVVPIITFPMQMGFGLDYHIFLIDRVIEFRRKGYDDRSATVLALGETGSVITSAGLIQVVAFLGMMPARSLIVSQFSVVMTTSLLVDMYVIRAVMVPASLALFGRYNWWPRGMPTPTKSIYDSKDL